jgi:hypothetical protein
MQALNTSGCYDLLLQTGLFAGGRQIPEQTDQILRAIYVMYPERMDSRMGMAYSFLVSGLYQEVIDFLNREILDREPDYMPALGLLAVAMRSAELPGWEALLKRVTVAMGDKKIEAKANAMLPKDEGNAKPRLTLDDEGDFVIPSRC